MDKKLFQDLRKAALAGVLVLVPIAVTLGILGALGRFLVDWAIAFVPAFIRPEQPFFQWLLALGLSLAVVLGLGYATRSYLGVQAIRASEAVLSRVPVVSSLYLGTKQLLEALLTTDKGYFQQVVLVEWPRREVWAVAFHTGDSHIVQGQKMINIFMPSTPNPTTGFYMMVPLRDVIQTEMTVEEAFKMIMSAGMVAPDMTVEIPPAIGEVARQEGVPEPGAGSS